MKKFFLILVPLLLLTGCPSEQEVQEITQDMIAKKVQADKLIQSGVFDLNNLLQAQEYFFAFGEKIHLMQADEKARESIKSLIKSKGIRQFCNSFILPVRTWKILEDYCSSGDTYRCSPDIREYKNVQKKLLELVGSSYKKQFENETKCN